MSAFRGFNACSCLTSWLPVYERMLQHRGVLRDGEELRIYQLIGGAEASGGTHATGGAFDITDLIGNLDVSIARQMGADATWARTKAQGFTPHLHGVLTGCPHNGPARYQIDAVRAGFNGLGRGGRGAADDGPRPLSGRDWRAGIAWANKQMEEDMATSDEILAELKTISKHSERAVYFARHGRDLTLALARAERARDADNKAEHDASQAKLDALIAAVDPEDA